VLQFHGLLDDMLSGVAHFSRDRDSFESLEPGAIPQQFARHEQTADNSEVRVCPRVT
jgi:chemotaxis methyl-accepting protein methylase